MKFTTNICNKEIPFNSTFLHKDKIERITHKSEKLPSTVQIAKRQDNFQQPSHRRDLYVINKGTTDDCREAYLIHKQRNLLFTVLVNLPTKMNMAAQYGSHKTLQCPCTHYSRKGSRKAIQLMNRNVSEYDKTVTGTHNRKRNLQSKKHIMISYISNVENKSQSPIKLVLNDIILNLF